MRNEKGKPTPNRVQSSLLELPRCEGGKDRKAGLKEKSASEREQRQVYLSVAERKQIQDRKAGLKEKSA